MYEMNQKMNYRTLNSAPVFELRIYMASKVELMNNRVILSGSTDEVALELLSFYWANRAEPF